MENKIKTRGIVEVYRGYIGMRVCGTLGIYSDFKGFGACLVGDVIRSIWRNIRHGFKGLGRLVQTRG